MKSDKSSGKSTTRDIFAVNCRIILESRGISQADLANAINETPQTVNKWLTAASFPSMEKVINIANNLDVSLDKLFGRRPRSAEPLDAARRRLAPLLHSLDSILPDEPTSEDASASAGKKMKGVPRGKRKRKSKKKGG